MSLSFGFFGSEGKYTDIWHDRLANKYYLKVADLAAIEADYYKAIGFYEKVGKVSIDNNLMKWSVKDYFFKAGICHLASGVCLIPPMKQNVSLADCLWLGPRCDQSCFGKL